MLMFQMDLFSIYLHMHSITASSELIVLLISVQLAGASVQHSTSEATFTKIIQTGL